MTIESNYIAKNNSKNRMLELEIKLIKIRQFPKKEINEELLWTAESLGLLTKRDKDKTCYRLFIELIKSSKNKEMLTSDELANRLELTRATVIHHLKNLIKLGLVKHIDNRYILCSDNLVDLIKEIDNNYKKTIKQILTVVQSIDNELKF